MGIPPEPNEPTPEPKEPTPEPKEPTPPPRPSTPPPEEVESILERMSDMGCDCDESDPPLLTSIPVRKPTPQPSNDDGEETRSQRRARILQAQREAMWSDEESEEEPEPAEEASNDAESKEPIFSENPDVAERVGAITKRVDQLKALLSSCPEANRDFVNGHIVSLQAEIAVLTAASRAVQNLSRKTTPRSTAEEESDQEESAGEEEEEAEQSEAESDEEWGSDDDISDLSDIQALIA